jgi:hypothetical protein
MSFLKVPEGVNLTLVEDELSLALSGDNVDKSEMLLGPSEPHILKYTIIFPQFQVQIHSRRNSHFEASALWDKSRTFTGSSFLAHDLFTFGWYPIVRKVMRTSPQPKKSNYRRWLR